MNYQEQEPMPTESPSQDHSKRYNDDVILRRHGYKIVERRNGREAVWERNGQRYTQSAALATVFDGGK